MTYLHDKNIVHGRLTSVNIYIEQNQRVKISLLDDDERQIATAASVDDQELPLERPKNSNTRPIQKTSSRVSFNLPALTYLSPELIRTINVTLKSGGVEMNSDLLTKEADVFSFGTLLFELFEERFPYASAPTTKTSADGWNKSPSSMRSPNLLSSLGLESPTSISPRLSHFQSLFSPQQAPSPPLGNIRTQQQTHLNKNWNGNIKTSASELIFSIGSGQIAKMNCRSDKCSPLIDHIVAACWQTSPHKRPSFKELRFE